MCAKGRRFLDDWVIDYSTPSADVVRVVAYSSTGTPLPEGASGVVALLDFTVASGASSVHESWAGTHEIVLSDENGLPIEPVGSTDGTFTVIPPVHHFVVQVIPAPPEPQGGDITDPLAFTVHVEGATMPMPWFPATTSRPPCHPA